MHNFGRYMGTSSIDMNVTDKRNIVLINGGNDRGKTTLLTAIKFALFGEQQGIKSNSLINYQQAKLGDGRMYVEIAFEHNGHEYNLRRSVKFRQVKIGNETPSSEPPRLSILEDGKNKSLNQAWLEHVLPMDVSQFFIFDGEQIQSYIDKSATSLKEPIEIILGIRELLHARKDVIYVSEKLSKERQIILEKQDNKHNKLKKFKEELKKHEDDQWGYISSLNQAKRDVAKYEGELNNHDLLKDLNKKIKNIKSTIEKLKSDERNCSRKIAEQRGNFGFFLLRPLLQFMHDGESSKVEEWESVAARGVLEKGLCICGRSLNDESVRVLSTKMSEGARIRHELNNLVSRISRRDFDVMMSGLVDALQKLRENHDETDRLSAELSNTEQKMDGIIDNGFDYDYTVKRLRETRGNIGIWEDDLRKCEELIIKTKQNIKKYEGEIRVYVDSPVLPNIERQLDMAERLVEATKYVVENFYEKRKPKLEKMISDVFLRLTNNPQFYNRIEIENDFSIRIVRRNGMSFPTTDYSPSAGMSQVIATAVISGLSNFATRDAPIVIDTPLGRLDPTHRKNVISHYSQMGRQVVILYQQSEMDDQDIQIIDNNVASEWEIASIPEQPGVSTISLVGSYL